MVGPSPRFARTSDGVRIGFVESGSGAALVHLPGIPFSNLEGEWRVPVLEAAYERLGRRVRLVQYDGRGTGLSQRDVSDFSLAAMQADLDAVVGALELERFALLGFYASVPVAIAYAARHPERVTRLILFGGSVRGWIPMSGPGMQALLSLIERDWDMFVESAAHAWLGWPDGESGRLAADWFRTATTPAIARAVLTALHDVDVRTEVATVACPALVIHRRDATVIDLGTSRDLAAALPHGELRVVDGSSASLFFERADEMVDLIAKFVIDGSPVGMTGETPVRATGPTTSARPPGPTTSARPAGLTPRELEVLRLLANGETNAEIAHRLGLSVHTVERHVANLYRKIDARGRADATAYAVRRGLA